MAAKEGHQEHPLKVYWIMWAALFILSAGSYAADFMEPGALRQFLILLFMFLKAAGIVAIFMHMFWERLALKFAILAPPLAIIVLIWLMSLEGLYVEDTRLEYYGDSTFEPEEPAHH
jgi:cytochrome c oxidase subunit 4